MTDTTLDLRARRKRAGLSFDQLAHAARCSVATCRMLENGWRPGKSEALRRVGLVLASYETDPRNDDEPLRGRLDDKEGTTNAGRRSD
jgi:Helix-turn-helix domain